MPQECPLRQNSPGGGGVGWDPPTPMGSQNSKKSLGRPLLLLPLPLLPPPLQVLPPLLDPQLALLPAMRLLSAGGEAPFGPLPPKEKKRPTICILSTSPYKSGVPYIFAG